MLKRAFPSANRLDLTWLGLSLAAFVALCWPLRRFTTDDAWISARSASNIVDGHGFVWNVGGPRVEPFSNPLLVAAEAVARAAGLEPIAAARAIGVGSALLLLVALARLAPEICGRTATHVALALTALCAPLALWALGGLETLPTALVLTVGVLLAARGRPGRGGALGAGVVLALLPWLRPEGIVVAVAIAVAAEARDVLRRDERRAALGRFAWLAGLPTASWIALEAERMLVYGRWLPNSVVYKTGSGPLLEVLGIFVGQALPVLLAAAGGLLVARRRQRLIAVPPLVYGIGALGALDSVNSFSRFLLPTWPMLALLCGLAFAAIGRRVRVPAVAIGGGLALAAYMALASSGSLPHVRSFTHRYVDCRVGARTDASAWLRANTPRQAAFSLSDVGQVSAHVDDRVSIDAVMLTDPLIQKTGSPDNTERVNRVFSEHPDVIMIVSAAPDRLVPRYPNEQALSRDPRFAAYRLRHIARGPTQRRCAYQLFIYERARAAPQITAGLGLRGN